MVCTFMIQIEFQFRYSFMRVIQEKEMHASTPKNDEINSVEWRQKMKGTHASTLKDNEFNSIQGRQEMKEMHASTLENDEYNSAEGRQAILRV